MRCESRYKLWLPSLIAGGLAVAAIFWASRSEAQKPNAKWFPDGNSVPANALKFYLVFSEPMTEGDIFTRLKLERQGDAGWLTIKGAFRETELWSPDSQRLTVWLHPGRQKTGVNLNEDEGPVLVEGGSYRLVLSKSATTQAGHPLGKGATLSFRATAADHTCLDPATWTFEKLRGEAANTKSARLAFPEPLDWAMLGSAFSIDGKPADVRVDDNARGITLEGSSAWTAGHHVLDVNPKVEDMAGNNLERAFEIDVTEPSAPGRHITTKIGFDWP